MSDKPFSMSATDNPLSHAASQVDLGAAAVDHFRNEIYDFGHRANSTMAQRDAGGVENSVYRGLSPEAAPPQNPGGSDAVEDHKLQIQMSALNAQSALDDISPANQNFQAQEINRQLKDAHLSPEDAQLWMKTFNNEKGSGFIAVQKPDGVIEVVRGGQT